MDLHLPFHTHYVRKLGASDAQAFYDHLTRLDAASRRDRFNGAVDDSFVRKYADRSFEPLTTVFGWFEDGVLRGAAELHRLPDGEPGPAEAAFSVEAAYQGNGVGTSLLKRMLHYAQNRGVKQIQVVTSPHNKPMQALARKFGAKMSYVYGETVGTIDAAPRTSLTMMLEAFEDMQGFVSSVLSAPQAALANARAREEPAAKSGGKAA